MVFFHIKTRICNVKSMSMINWEGKLVNSHILLKFSMLSVMYFYLYKRYIFINKTKDRYIPRFIMSVNNHLYAVEIAKDCLRKDQSLCSISKQTSLCIIWVDLWLENFSLIINRRRRVKTNIMFGNDFSISRVMLSSSCRL